MMDDGDYQEVNKYVWHSYDRYVESCINGRNTKLHRFILGVSRKDVFVDHINGITTDNRRCNLRLCSRYENLQNRKLNKDNTTGVKGVVKLPSGRYRVRIQAFGKRVDYGVYSSIDDARNVRIAKAKELHGQFYREA